jgi:hypothetical protein
MVSVLYCNNIVAIRGIWLRSLANDRIPVPTILHQQFPYLLRHKFFDARLSSRKTDMRQIV